MNKHPKLDIAEDIHSLSDFKRRTSNHVKRLLDTGRPSVLTVNGKGRIVVQDAHAYQQLLERLERAESAVRERTQ
jgi:prevent-host-death family protein